MYHGKGKNDELYSYSWVATGQELHFVYSELIIHLSELANYRKPALLQWVSYVSITNTHSRGERYIFCQFTFTSTGFLFRSMSSFAVVF